jgi:gliding motility-associated-like protein
LKKTLIVLLLWPFLLNGQHFSKNGRFSITYSQGCVPATIYISQHQFIGQPRNYDFGVGQPRTEDTVFTYTNPGIYHIVQLIDATTSNQQSKLDTLVFTVVESPTPIISTFICANNTVEVSVLDNNYDFYRIYFTNNDSIDVKSKESKYHSYLSSFVTIKVKGLLVNGFTSNCGEVIKEVAFQNELIAPKIDTAFFQEDCNGKYDLSIKLATTTNYLTSIFLEENGLKKILYQGELSYSLVVQSLSVDAESQKCIIIEVEDVCSKKITSSNPFCISILDYQNEYFQSYYATFEGPSVKIFFKVAANDSILIEKLHSNGSFMKLDKVISPTYFDHSPNQQSENIYRLSPNNQICNETTSKIVSPPHIKLNSKGRFDNRIQIGIVDPKNQIEEDYTLKVIFYSQDSSITNMQDYENQLTLPYEIGEYQNIQVFYQYSSGTTVRSNVIPTKFNYSIFVPSAFTPGNDGLNDQLQIFGLPTPNATLQIFNRWGEIIFFSKDATIGWNGKIQGDNAPVGTYRYKVIYEIPSGDLRTQVGTFVLIRK